tara:strand:+ start:6837 stop:7331 length:495 start_codon:yes stop_codon:yes gene_type:complete
VGVDIKVEGLRELEQKLVKLGGAVAHKQLKKALFAGTTQTFKEYKATVPVRTGRLQKGIKRRSMRNTKLKTSKSTAALFGGRRAAAGVIIFNKAPHAHLLELGTKRRQTTGKGRTRRVPAGIDRGLVKPRHYLMKAFKRKGISGNQAVNKFRDSLSKNIRKLTK